MTAHHFRRVPWLVLIAVAAVGLAGCRPPDEPSGRFLADRWVASTSPEILSLADVSREETLFDWRFDQAAERERWRPRFVDERSRPVSGGLRVVPDGQRPSLDRPVELDASEVDRIDVEIRGVRRGFVRLMWAGPGEPLAAERSVRLEADAAHGDTFGFELVEHPLWTGRIGRLRLVPTSVVRQPVVVTGVRGTHYRLAGDRIGALVDRPVGLELDHDLRTGVVLVPGGEWRRTIEVPRGGELELFYGRPTRSGGAMIEVVVAPATSDETVVSSFVLDRRGVWQRGRADLAAFAGDTVEVALRMVASEGSARRRELAYVATPVVLGAARRSEMPPNVVVILVDTLRADRVSANGYRYRTTPNLDRWTAGRAVNFTAAIAPSPWTLPSHVSLFTGRDAIVHGSNHTAGARLGLDLLAEQLRRAGYTTRAITGGVFLHPRFGFDQGFDGFRYWPSDRDQGDEIADGTERALAALDELADRPFFLFFHTYEVHKPYHEREPYFSEHFDGDATGLRLKVERAPSTEATGFVDRRSFRIVDDDGEHDLGAGDQPYLDALYDGGVHFADAHVGRILDRLEGLRSSRDTLIVVTSDHGEALGDRGLASHAYLWDFNLRIPLVVSLPGGEGAGGTVGRQVRLIDVLPTILEVAGLEPSQPVDGSSLVGLCTDPAAPFPDEAWAYAASTNYGLALRVGNRLKYTVNDTVWQAVRGDEALYRVDVDPGERDDLAAGSDGDLAVLRASARAKLGAPAAGTAITVSNPLGRRVAVRLEPVNPTRLKAVDVPDGVVVEHEAGAARLHLPPSSRVRLRMESPDPEGEDRFEVDDGSGRELCGFAVDRWTAADGVLYCASPECCGEPIDGAPSDLVTVGLAALGAGDPHDERFAGPIDDELKRKLEALGYLHSE